MSHELPLHGPTLVVLVAPIGPVRGIMHGGIGRGTRAAHPAVPLHGHALGGCFDGVSYPAAEGGFAPRSRSRTLVIAVQRSVDTRLQQPRMLQHGMRSAPSPT